MTHYTEDMVYLCSQWQQRQKEKNKGWENGRQLKGDGDSWRQGCRVTHWSCRASTLRRRWSSGRPHSRSPRGPSPHSASLSASGREEHMPAQQITFIFLKEILTKKALKEKKEHTICVTCSFKMIQVLHMCDIYWRHVHSPPLFLCVSWPMLQTTGVT